MAQQSCFEINWPLFSFSVLLSTTVPTYLYIFYPLLKIIICQTSNIDLEMSIKSQDAMSTFETHPVIWSVLLQQELASSNIILSQLSQDMKTSSLLIVQLCVVVLDLIGQLSDEIIKLIIRPKWWKAPSYTKIFIKRCQYFKRKMPQSQDILTINIFLNVFIY